MQRWAVGGIGALGLGALFTLAGCPGNLDNPQRFADGGNAAPTDNIPACLAKVFNKTEPPGKCSGGMGCHEQNTLGFGGDLDLTSPGVTGRLVNANATHAGVDMDGSTCPTAKLIDTASPMDSWLLKKINGMQGLCGSSMPQVGTLTSAEKACITQFVMDSAADAGAAMGGTGSMTTGGAGGSTAIAGTGGMPAAGGAAMGGSGGASGGASGSAGTGGT